MAEETFRSAILPPSLRKTPSLEALYPWLYLKGISTGDFGDALQALLGSDARGLSATTITRLKAVWEQEYQDWSKRSLAHRGYAYVWADGVYFGHHDPHRARCVRRVVCRAVVCDARGRQHGVTKVKNRVTAAAYAARVCGLRIWVVKNLTVRSAACGPALRTMSGRPSICQPPGTTSASGGADTGATAADGGRAGAGG